MTRPLTRMEAVELIEDMFNLDSEEALQAKADGSATFEVFIADMPLTVVRSQVRSFTDERAIPIDMDTIDIIDTVLDGIRSFDCVAVTISTKERSNAVHQ